MTTEFLGIKLREKIEPELASSFGSNDVGEVNDELVQSVII